MLVKVNSVAHRGIESIGVVVEVNVSNRGFPSFDIVGLASKAVAESKERVKTALTNSGFKFPNKKITVNLAPADIPKEGSFYDLPIAVGIIAGSRGFEAPEDTLFYGELSLDGTLRETKGVFLLAIYAQSNNFSQIFVPKASCKQASVVKGVVTRPTQSLSKIINHLEKGEELPPLKHKVGFEYKQSLVSLDFMEILGQQKAKRALEIAAAGGHNVFMQGPPGSGKSMLAKATPSILPALEYNEMLEITKIYSSAGLLSNENPFISVRPFRSPHHTISYSGFLGGGSRPKAGELSLAHRGVLFLDEFPEFSRRIIESLRQPLEDRQITISRARETAKFPCNFMLIAASNPCPCGYKGHKSKNCVCTEYQVNSYKKKISGPILDRFDLVVTVDSVDVEDLDKFHKERRQKDQNERLKQAESSLYIRKRVDSARQIQLGRFKDESIYTNSEMTNKLLSKYCVLTPKSMTVLNQAVLKFNMSARSYFRVIKISQTIADLDKSEKVCQRHVAESLQYRIKN